METYLTKIGLFKTEEQNNQNKDSELSKKTDQYKELNDFQSKFFTNISTFENYSNYEIKKYGYILLNNIAKGFPNLVDIIINLKGLNWTGVTSPALLKALQHRFVNKYTVVRIPQFVYYKNLKPEKETTKAKVSKKSKDLMDFDDDIRKQICEILQYDSKTYEYLKYSEKVQFLGKQIHGEWMQQESMKKKKSKSK